MTHDIERSNSLADLAHRIKVEHEAAGAAVRRGAEHAVNAGALLIEAKAQLQHGQWLPWLRRHCGMPERTAQLYMRLAKHAPEIRNVADLTVRKAIETLAPLQTEEEARAAARLAEGEAILECIAVADAVLRDEIRIKMLRQRDYAIALYKSDERHAVLAAMRPGDRTMVSRWRTINDDDIQEVQWRVLSRLS